MITLNLLKQKKAFLTALLFVTSLSLFSQQTSNNTEITGVTVEFAFDEEVTDSKNNVKERIVDNDDDTDWAGNLGNATGEASIIFNLGAAYDLAEIQYLTVAKDDPYGFQLLVSTTGSDAEDFTDVYGGAKQQSNIDGTYKQFELPTIQTGVTYVKLICLGRIDATTESNTSAWNTISELRFYKEGSVASTTSNELRQVSLYPNPTNNQLNIIDFNDKVSKIEIFNLLGKKVVSSSSQSINTSNLANGIYLVKLSDLNNVSATKKIVIQH